jgi:hypothetical protein
MRPSARMARMARMTKLAVLAFTALYLADEARAAGRPVAPAPPGSGIPAAAPGRPAQGTAGPKGATAASGEAADASWVRVGVVVASARGIEGDRPLRYAHRDGERLESMLGSVGQIEPANLFLLKAEGKDGFLANLARIGDRIAELKAARRKVFLQFYYSGHGGAKRFHFADGSLAFDEVKAALGGSKADARVYVLDVCFGASFFNSKGFRTAPPVQLQLEMDQAARGEVTISSSSMDEQAYEVKSLGGSIFTSHWIMALRGAGDRNRDGQVTLFEAYNYAYDRTSGYSAETLDRPQHPSFQMDLTGARDVTLARLLQTSTGILFKGCPAGLYNVVDLQRGIQIGELRIPEGEEFTLALEPGKYRVFYMPGSNAGDAATGKPGAARAPSQAADLVLANATMAALPFTAFKAQTAAQGLPKGADPGMGWGMAGEPSSRWKRIGYSAWAGAAGFEDPALQEEIDKDPALDGHFGTGGSFPKPGLKADFGFDVAVAVAGAWSVGARLGYANAAYERKAVGAEPLASLTEADRARYPVEMDWKWNVSDTRLGAWAGRNFQVTPRQGIFVEAGASAVWRTAAGRRTLDRPLYATVDKYASELSGQGYRLEAGLGYRVLLPGSVGARRMNAGLRLMPYYTFVSAVRKADSPNLAAMEYGCAAVAVFSLTDAMSAFGGDRAPDGGGI